MFTCGIIDIINTQKIYNKAEEFTMRVKRIDLIEKYIYENKLVSIDKLCEEFQISKNTVRRDLDTLTKKGVISKVYGGAIAINKNTENVSKLISFNERHIKNSEAKDRIAKAAANYVQDGDTIFIDSGTSTINIINYLSHINQLTVVTNSIQVLYKALSYPNINVIGLPGNLKHDTASLVGISCVKDLKTYNINKAFMACTAISLKSGITNASAEEYEIKKTAIEKSHEHYLLVDHSKFDKTSLMTYCLIEQLDYVISDIQPNDTYMDYFNSHNVKTIIASELEL